MAHVHTPGDHLTPDHPVLPLEEQLALAASVCTDAGESLTPLRRRVLELLLCAPGATKAYDILDKLGGKAPAKPPTIYRALEFLVRMGFAHKVESLNAFVACGIGSCQRTTVFLICQDCLRTVEVDAGHALVDVDAAAHAAGFSLSRTILEAYGQCAGCRAAD